MRRRRRAASALDAHPADCGQLGSSLDGSAARRDAQGRDGSTARGRRRQLRDRRHAELWHTGAAVSFEAMGAPDTVRPLCRLVGRSSAHKCGARRRGRCHTRLFPPAQGVCQSHGAAASGPSARKLAPSGSLVGQLTCARAMDRMCMSHEHKLRNLYSARSNRTAILLYRLKSLSSIKFYIHGPGECLCDECMVIRSDN